WANKKALLFRVGLRVVVGEEEFDATGLPAPDLMYFSRPNYKSQMQKGLTLSSEALCSGR
ncbi:hypothetical protein AB4402_14945, partial [Vibrio breoganii]